MSGSRMVMTLAALGLFALLGASDADAHVSFLRRQVPLSPTIGAQLRLPHGCNGSPTVRLRMRVPKGVTDVRSQESKDGMVSILAQGAFREVTWSGRWPADRTVEFLFSFDIDASVKPGDVLYFPIVQECEVGVLRWIDVKSGVSVDVIDDQFEDESTSPAPAIRILRPR